MLELLQRPAPIVLVLTLTGGALTASTAVLAWAYDRHAEHPHKAATQMVESLRREVKEDLNRAVEGEDKKIAVVRDEVAKVRTEVADVKDEGHQVHLKVQRVLLNLEGEHPVGYSRAEDYEPAVEPDGGPADGGRPRRRR